MSIEYERKFLLKDDGILKMCFDKKHIIQNYLNLGINETRVRAIDNKKYFFTEKIGLGKARDEFEKEITVEQYKSLLKKYSQGRTVEKDRYFVTLQGTKSCEINVFLSPRPIKLIEVEFCNAEQMENFSPPEWFGKEVTESDDYYSFNIATKE